MEVSERRTSSVPGSSSVSRSDLVEQPLRDEGRKLFGRPDRISQREEGVTIHDLKSGSAQTAEEVSPRQRRQLLFYSHLWDVERGSLPVRAEIERGDGSTTGFGISRAEVDGLISDVLKLRDQFNAARANLDPPALAAPTPDHCRYCDFRPVCAPYMLSVDESWHWSATRAGAVSATWDRPDGAAIDVDVIYPTEDAGTLCRVTRLPSGGPPALGSFVAVTDAEPTASPTQIRSAWHTVLEIWNGGSPP